MQKNNTQIYNLDESTYKASSGSATYRIYGEDAFDEEYSIGAFVPASDITGRECGSGFTHIGVSTDGKATYYIGTNQEKDDNVYVNVYDGFKMGTETYDYRVYFWLIEGDDFRYQVGTMTDDIDSDGTYGAFHPEHQDRMTFEDDYQTERKTTVIASEIHFYKSGTLATNNPEEVDVKGVGTFTDLDCDTNIEGYKFINGVDETTGIYLTSDTTVKQVEDLTSEQEECIEKYTTSTEGGWFGTIVTTGSSSEISLTNQALHYEFESSKESPLTYYYYCGTSWRGINPIFNKYSDISYRRRSPRWSK